MVFPPNQNILEGMLECGYEDAAQYFRTVPRIFDEITTAEQNIGFNAHNEPIPKPNTDKKSQKRSHERDKAPSHDDKQRKKKIATFEGAAYRAWLQFAGFVAGSWLAGLTVYALYVDF